MSIPVFLNDWSEHLVPAEDYWVPSKFVSVVIATWQPGHKLELALASLAAQTYPQELFEVIVVDDGNLKKVELPLLRPVNTRLIRVEDGWGKANALNQGFSAAQGEIFFCMDDDIVSSKDHLWNNAKVFDGVNYAIVKNDIIFVEDTSLEPAEVQEAVANDSIDEAVNKGGTRAQWLEDRFGRSEGLLKYSNDIFGSFTGGSCSMSKELFFRVGGYDNEMVLGEDIELGYRLMEAGGVLVPVRTAPCYHLGQATSQKRSEEVNRHNNPYFAQRVPLFRDRRARKPAGWKVPIACVRFNVTESSHEVVKLAVDTILTGTTHDVQVELVGPWDSFTATRRDPFAGSGKYYRMKEWYKYESRVDFVAQDEVRSSVFPTPYLIDFSDLKVTVAAHTITEILDFSDHRNIGLLRIPIVDTDHRGPAYVTITRTAFFERLLLLGNSAVDLTPRDFETVSGVWIADPQQFGISQAADD